MKDGTSQTGHSEENGSSVKAIGTVMFITMAGKLLGLLRDRLLATNYGTGMYANAFLTASRIPRVFFDMLFASAIAASFIPVFSEVLKKKGHNKANIFGSNFITLVAGSTLLLTAVGMICAAPLVELFADGYDAQTASLAVSLTRIMFPTIFFTGIAYSFVGILQSFDEFNIPALISLISNAIIIAYYLLLNDRFGIYGLAVAFLIGWMMQAVIQIPSLRKKKFKYLPVVKIKTREMQKVIMLMLPVMVSTWVQPINLTINTRFASHLNGGSGVSAIEYSTNLYLIIIGVFILSVTNVVFPRLSRQNVDNDEEGFVNTVRTTMHGSMYFMLPMMCGVMALARPLTDLIYGGGEFGADDLNITSGALFYVTLGMIGYGVQNILSRVFFAKLDGKTPLVAAVISIAVNIVMCMLLVKPMGVAGLALSSAAASTANAAVLAAALEIKGEGYHNRIFIIDVLKMAAASLIMTAAVILCMNSVDDITVGIPSKLLVLILPTIVGMLIYFVTTFLFKLDEAKLIMGVLKKSGKE